MDWLYFLLAFIGFFLLRALYYYHKLARIKELHTYYLKFLGNNNYSFLQHKSQIISLFKEAGIKDFGVPYARPMGLGTLMTATLSGFDNIGSRSMDVVNVVVGKFEEAIGVFNQRMHQSYDPFFWVELIIKLPEKVLSFVHLSPPDGLMKFIQLCYWTVGFLVAMDKFNIIDIASWLNNWPNPTAPK